MGGISAVSKPRHHLRARVDSLRLDEDGDMQLFSDVVFSVHVGAISDELRHRLPAMIRYNNERRFSWLDIDRFIKRRRWG